MKDYSYIEDHVKAEKGHTISHLCKLHKITESLGINYKEDILSDFNEIYQFLDQIERKIIRTAKRQAAEEYKLTTNEEELERIQWWELLPLHIKDYRRSSVRLWLEMEQEAS